MEMLKTIKFLTIVLLAFFVVIYVIIVFYVYFNQVGMVFQSAKLSKDHRFDYQHKFEELNIKSFDGVQLNGLLFKAEHSKGLVFYLHGNAGTLETWGSIAKIYTNLGYDIFILDYRSFGKSEGEIENEEQLNKDVSVVYKTLTQRYPENKIIITGYSIGSGLATILASENNPKALILQSPYYSFTELSSSKVPFFPDFLKKFTLETYEYLPKIKVPIYIFHGMHDQLIPYENSVRLSKLLKSNGHFYPLKDQEHTGMNENNDFQNQLKIILQ
ncbi:alpha/beta fold hydrolase [Flavobacterium psychroterrae]|jgi:alpha-beta hydrolase superfamily lysophospholipase|uniref:Alpha/beta fold hydrolase n=1 Tax=Flavobacterium psychroterrae TaxID=2133767 RepID=A0ABS5PG99_9FLAO|nr:alpha/beta fold hydrolase [Flavobacterium psychroterrae]MBS7233328.1 alpha/beta fold hydrolase [Flavobacterium psychroterrae]